MARQILIPLSGTDRIEKVLPYLEQSAHVGVKVVFVVHYGLSGFRELMDQLLAHQQEGNGELLSQAGNRQISHDETGQPIKKSYSRAGGWRTEGQRLT